MAAPLADQQWGPLVGDLITQSPPGHLADVVGCCRRLTAAELSADLLGRACCEHNERTLLVVPLGAEFSSHGIVCEAGRLGDRGEKQAPYLDPRTDSVFVVDQELQECTSVTRRSPSAGVEASAEAVCAEAAAPYRRALELELERYLAERFPTPAASGVEGLSAVAVYSSQGTDGAGVVDLQVVISSRRTRQLGLWTGAWGSRWRVAFRPGQAEPAELAGTVEFATHYAEEGNVHFRRKAARAAKVADTGDPARFAAAAAAAIRRLEDEFHEATEDACASFGQGALKAFRRVLPLSAQRFDWRPLTHALVRDMKAAAKEGGC